ncbi:ComEC/Rec2 family competence protein [Mycoplasmopsis pullorum]|uniref:ComEC/Rec2 family competence protein n=2 Tax=Mycoplasmopsis pullorum TaxID=48003 RepID=UPI001117C4FC|nr:ComEC/Rec2 family competence protein [Mycoplasmopsis pullorum]TNK82927.1 hypothetical protein C4M93_03290 [Mycoplasmopsis pullorum]
MSAGIIILAILLILFSKTYKLIFVTLLGLLITYILINAINYFYDKHQISEFLVLDKTPKGYSISWNTNRYMLISSQYLKEGYRYSGDIKILKSGDETKISYFTFHTIGFLKVDNIIEKNASPTIQCYIKGLFENYPKYYKKYFINLVFGYGYHDLKVEIYYTFIKLGIMHFIVVSGMHFSFAYFTLDLLLKKVKNPMTKKIIKFIVISVYFLMCKLSIATIRSFLFLSLWTFIGNYRQQKFIMNAKIFIGICLFMPHSIYNASFWYTFLISQCIYFLFLFEYKKKIYLNIILFVLVQVNSQFLNIWYRHQLNITTFLYVPLLSPLMEITFYIAIFFFPFYKFLDSYFMFVDHIFEFLSKWVWILEFDWTFHWFGFAIIVALSNSIQFIIWKNICINKKL